MIFVWSNSKYAGQPDMVGIGFGASFNWSAVAAAGPASVADAICQAVEMFPAIQQAVMMTGGIDQSVDVRPVIQQTASMGCLDCG